MDFVDKPITFKLKVTTFLYDWENYFTVFGWEQSNFSLILTVCSAVQINARVFVIFSVLL